MLGHYRNLNLLSSTTTTTLNPAQLLCRLTVRSILLGLCYLIHHVSFSMKVQVMITGKKKQSEDTKKASE